MFLWNKNITLKVKTINIYQFFMWNQNNQYYLEISQCQCTPLNFSYSLLLKLSMLEDNFAYLNVFVCRSMPLPLQIYSLLFFFISSKSISGMKFSKLWLLPLLDKNRYEGKNIYEQKHLDSFRFNEWFGWNFKENSSYGENACCLWDPLFINSDKALFKYIFETIADLSNIFIQ